MVDYDKNQIYRKCFSFTILAEAKATAPMEDKVIFGYPTTVVFNEYDLRENIILHKIYTQYQTLVGRNRRLRHVSI